MARTREGLGLPIAVAFQTSNRSNAKTKVKIWKNKDIDELINANFDVPGIPKSAVIKEIVIGNDLTRKLAEKYNNK